MLTNRLPQNETKDLQSGRRVRRVIGVGAMAAVGFLGAAGSGAAEATPANHNKTHATTKPQAKKPSHNSSPTTEQPSSTPIADFCQITAVSSLLTQITNNSAGEIVCANLNSPLRDVPSANQVLPIELQKQRTEAPIAEFSWAPTEQETSDVNTIALEIYPDKGEFKTLQKESTHSPNDITDNLDRAVSLGTINGYQTMWTNGNKFVAKVGGYDLESTVSSIRTGPSDADIIISSETPWKAGDPYRNFGQQFLTVFENQGFTS